MKEIALSEGLHGPYNNDSKEVVASPIPFPLLTTPQRTVFAIGCRPNLYILKSL